MTFEQLDAYRCDMRRYEETNDTEAGRRAEQVRGFVSGINDTYMRQMISARYIKGLMWSEIADLFYPNSEDSCRMMVKRYLKRCGVK